MAPTHNMSGTSKPSMFSDIGNKVKHVAEFAGAVKGLYDVGRAIYQGVQTIGPMVATAGII